jgi:CHAT domain-containing protein
VADQLGADDIRAARRELNAVIEEIREVPGYEDFLAPPTFEDIAGETHDQPLVYVGVAEPSGFACLVRNGQVAALTLDELTSEAVTARVERHLDDYARYRAAADEGLDSWNAALADLTAWLWDVAMGPIMAQLGDDTEVVLVAGGLLGLLPLHAAWTPDSGRPTGRRHVLDDAIVSYVPNARSLRVARQLAAEVPARRLLTVAEPRPVRAARLPMADCEAAVAGAAFPGAHRTLRGGEANVLSFGWAAPEADVLHLACHGLADLANPLDSGLLLAGGTMTLRDLLAFRFRLRLAVLSACETALPGTDLPDEVVALPSGLLQAGVAGVVASQWAVPDRATALLMVAFYQAWRHDGLTPAAALRAAQKWLRDTTNAEKTTYLTELDGWLPPEVVEGFVDRLGRPDRRGHDGMHSWAAFAHVGA